MSDFYPMHVKYFISTNLNTIVDNLNGFKALVYPNPEPAQGPGQSPLYPDFPSVCIIGLGRCGSNISLDVVSLVSKAKSAYLSQLKGPETSAHPGGNNPWLRSLLSPGRGRRDPSVYLVEPIVMVGDLDQDIGGRIHYSSYCGESNYLSEYDKLSVMNFSDVHAGGAGNIPILGQYLAKVILNKDIDTFEDPNWKLNHAFFVDSCGIKANQARLFFYIFSAGGGTGSGMAAEFGLAQQYAYMSKTFDGEYTPKRSGLHPPDRPNDNVSFVFEPIFTCGIGILPNITSQHQELSEALHINAGRLLCRYLAEEMDFATDEQAFNDSDNKEPRGIRLRPWNALMLISNDIMKYANVQTDEQANQDIDVNAMEKYANQYVSQQIFNILTAQALTADYDENYFRKAGINIVETIRLDANDLFMSLSGPVAVAYSEEVMPAEGKEGAIDIDDLFLRSIDLPHFNVETDAIEGISILPVASNKYREVLQRFKDSNFAPEALEDLCFFKHCSSTVTIISLPKGFKLSYSDLNRLKVHLNNIFPNTTLKRYSMVIGASANLSLTTIIAKSPCLSDEFLTLIVAYIKRCFAKESYSFNGDVDEAILKLITDEAFDEAVVDAMLNDYEDPAMILDTNWYAIKPMYEKKYRELINDPDKFIGVDEVKLSKQQIKQAIRYLRSAYRHRVSKTRMLSLNKLGEPGQ